jgi:hypothetical protein
MLGGLVANYQKQTITSYFNWLRKMPQLLVWATNALAKEPDRRVAATGLALSAHQIAEQRRNCTSISAGGGD